MEVLCVVYLFWYLDDIVVKVFLFLGVDTNVICGIVIDN